MTHVHLPGSRVHGALLTAAALFLLVVPSASSQQVIDYNTYYRFPVSAGFGFRTLSPLSVELSRDTNMTEFSATSRIPLPFFPMAQPFAKLGFVNVAWLAEDELGLRDHIQVFAELGATYSQRFSKNFEGGGGLSLGFGQSYYPNLVDDGTSRRSNEFIAALFGALALNPSYALSIEVIPSIRYQHVLQPIPDWDFDGFSFGIGVNVHYRFGEDPDAPRANIQSIQFGEADLDPVYPAMQSWYVDNPVGSIAIKNIETFPVSSIEVSFLQGEYMDAPTVSGRIEELESGETATVDLLAAFNDKVFGTLGDRTVAGEVIVKYTSRNRVAEQRQTVNFTLLDKSSITWDDDRKAGAFITPADSAVRNYSSYVRQVGRPAEVEGLSGDLQKAMQLYYALQVQGIIYQVDPNAPPFAELQEDPIFVDSVSIARETLGRGTGDCDDLTVLFNTMLETVGVKTAYITTPGHIYSAFSTGLGPDDYRLIHPDPEMTVEIDGELWIPVEITLVDTGDFLAAWRYGVEDYGIYNETPELRGFFETADAQRLYNPIGLTESDAGIQYAAGDQIVTSFRRGMDRIIEAIIDDYSNRAQQSGRKRDFNTLGIVSADYGRYASAERAFNTALSLDRNYLSPLINLGNVYFLQDQFQSALRNYHRAEENLVARNRADSPTYQALLLNIAKSYHALENFDRAQEYYDLLREINPDMAARNTYLEEGQGRASRAQQGPGILFVDPEEEE